MSCQGSVFGNLYTGVADTPNGERIAESYNIDSNENSSRKKVVGKFEISGVLDDSPFELWNLNPFGGFSEFGDIAIKKELAIRYSHTLFERIENHILNTSFAEV